MMNSMFNPGSYPRHVDTALLLLRLVTGGFMLTHGVGKLDRLLTGGDIQFADPIGVGMTASLVLAVFAEVFCALCVMLGFATRLSAVPLIITMLVAAFIVHAGDGFGKQELPLLYATMFLLLALTGAGKASVDAWIHARIGKK